jgi:hypothetical protein
MALYGSQSIPTQGPTQRPTKRPTKKKPTPARPKKTGRKKK